MKSLDSVLDNLANALHARFGHEIAIPAAVADSDGITELFRLANRATHRSWAADEVSPELVKFLVACALTAPSKSFLQQCDVIHVRSPSQKEAIQKLVPTLPWLSQAPALLIFCGNSRRFKRLFDRRSLPFTNDHLDAFFNATVDASLVLMSCIEAAGILGLVGCPISMLRDKGTELAGILDLPKRVFPVAGLCLGYPAQTRQITPRFSLDATFYVDRIGNPSDDDLIDEFDQRYAQARTTVRSSSSVSKAWSDERSKQYANPLRGDWGAFVRSMKFDLS